MSKILITGGAGFVGSNLTKYCLDKGHETVVIDDMSSSSKIKVDQRARLIKGKVEDEKDLEKAFSFKPDYVFHLAAQSYPQTSFTSPIDTLDTNVQGTFRVLEAIRKSKNPNESYAIKS